MVSTASVLRFPRSDEEGSFVLVNATQTRTKPLDLKLVGTDGLAPYVASLRHDRVAALLVKNSPCAEEEWVDILSGLLTQNPGEGVEAIATVESEVAITVTVRRRVKGITQRLGTLELKHNADEEIELFDWCGLAAAAVVQANVTLAAVTTKQTELEASVWQLKSQLDELVEAKTTDETELLLKFRDLLNAKKVKIREQQKILAAAASGDPPAVPPSQTSQPGKAAKTAGQGRTATKSRASKRKAAAPAAEDDDDESDDGFEKMDVDTAVSKEADAEMSDQQRDTTDDETETASEHDEDEDDAEEEEAKPAQNPARVQEDDAPPPARALPFMKKTAKKAAPAPPPAGSETESDDEL
ncbi:hypothetical protein D7B24_002386 [Verticillium nonalfalfae]|uniref:Mitotic apparatus protein p62 n=1 Tax=Verticillium nonalfalfae TaxID=1051616 RepID=A0A3M9Y111_9PEZI|nr:uncharacterized protein D7B24_002386 [Verticillium nonalfalfae]RNJ53088.1 hypothetical protein D7B24_002386 [Verticillium nonalfalfae]